ncbi:MAG: ChbG/HpnK family deacetylase [Candidatus Omnitrophota bacterium]
MSRSLIVNADDFGLDNRINQGIAECCSSGIVRSISLVANGPAFEHALSLARQMPDTGIGVHLCLVNEKPLLAGMAGQNGLLPQDCYRLFFKLCSRRLNLLDVEQELDAQIKKILDSGITPTHLDSHQYTHLIPAIFDIVMRLGKKYNIKWIRCPRGWRRARGASSADLFKKTYLALFSRRRIEALKGNGFRCADISFGFTGSGRLSEQAVREFLQRFGSGMADLACHPGYLPQSGKYRAWGYCWEEEAAVLKSKGIRTLIEKLNISLTNYAA